MRRIIFVAVGLLAGVASVWGQKVPLTAEGSKNVLWVDFDRLYDYNQYEKSRWGLGLQYDWNFDTSKYEIKTLSLSGYGAYGYADQRFKWGAKVDLQGASRIQPHTYVGITHDLTPAASRTLVVPALAVLQSPASFMTRLYSDTWRLTAGYSQKFSQWKLSVGSVELRLARERPLWWEYGPPVLWTMVYPASSADLKTLKHYDYLEAAFYAAHTSGWSGRLETGLVDFDESHPFAFLRLLAQYENSFRLAFLELNVFAQGGFTSREVPYSRMFDLGGSWGCPLSLNHTLLTARQNEFTANVFGLVNMKLATANPVFKLYNNVFGIGTSPRPFITFNAAWGESYDDFYPAPDKGICEVGAGIDGLLMLGQIYWGLGAAYRLVPESAPYHFTKRSDNLTLLITAYLAM